MNHPPFFPNSVYNYLLWIPLLWICVDARFRVQQQASADDPTDHPPNISADLGVECDMHMLSVREFVDLSNKVCHLSSLAVSPHEMSCLWIDNPLKKPPTLWIFR